ncbi:MAG TPA: SusC/RagA family TonB-linked outer membrane protein, partial [Chitinophagaceae bacterium]|nr:SusC/RagA family TonB-linked outer membrane protein [Chitinophagaceae bacterium]
MKTNPFPPGLQSFTLILKTNQERFNSSASSFFQTCLIFVMLLSFSGQLYAIPAQDISSVEIKLELKNESLLNAFRKIEEQSAFHFMYRNEDVRDIANLNVAESRRSVAAFLKIILANTSLTFKQVDQRILISPKPVQNTIAVSTSATSPLLEAGKLVDKVVSGQVTDSAGGALQGVSISVKGTSTGTSTDGQGRFRINVPDGGVLVFTFIGFETREITVNDQSVINISMGRSSARLNEVVVTALGIRREAKSLGYATSTVAPEAVTINRTSNFMNALEGKVAGVNITALGSGPAGTTKIRIRGQSSFGGNNSPLIVVNGVPIDNTNFGARGDASARGSNRTSDGGDGLSSIDPDNIESMTVLKGAAASALYGSRAKDGVIMITTKTRGRGNGIGLEFNTNYTNDTPLDYTDYQYEYGQGENGVRPTTPNPTSGQWSFGEKFKPGMTQILFDGVEVPYTPQRNQISQYYRKGNNLTNTITLSSGGEFGGFNISLSNMTSTAILPTSDFNRKNVNIGFTTTMAKKLTVTGTLSYSHEKRNNPPNIGEQDYSPVVIYNMANSMPMDLLKKYAFDKNGDEFPWSRFTNRTNPYFALSRFDHITRDRIFGNITARYDITDWLYLQGRIGQDFFTRSQDYNLPTGSQRQPAPPPGFVNGEYIQDERRFRELNTDILLGAKQKFGSFGVDLNLGGNQMHRKLNRNNVLVNDFYTRGLYTLGNGRQLSPIYEISERQVNSVYAAAELSYKGMLYVNGTVRNDWFSTLSP